MDEIAMLKRRVEKLEATIQDMIPLVIDAVHSQRTSLAKLESIRHQLQAAHGDES